jgi:alpha-tubulin suppressor-like RCC1 family protein
VQVQFPPGVQIAFIPDDVMPYDTGLAVDTNGNVWGWGLNEKGELCLGNTEAQSLPVQLPLTGVTTLAGASGHAVYDSNGVLYSCGEGILGAGSKTLQSFTPVPVKGLNGRAVTELVSSFANAGALLDTGKYYDWGWNNSGELGNGTVTKRSTVPVKVTFPDSSPVVQVAQGGSSPTFDGQTIVMLADGSLFAWGNDSASQLGDGGTGMQPSPVQIHAPAGVTYSILATGGSTSYAVTTEGDVYAWGNSKEGESGGREHADRHESRHGRVRRLAHLLDRAGRRRQLTCHPQDISSHEPAHAQQWTKSRPLRVRGR